MTASSRFPIASSHVRLLQILRAPGDTALRIPDALRFHDIVYARFLPAAK